MYGKKMFLWNEIKSYNISGNEKSGNLFLNFQTEKTFNNKNILKSKNAISISSKDYKIKMEELINKINEIKCSNCA
jgi:phosphoenolpyruvate carboxylase